MIKFFTVALLLCLTAALVVGCKARSVMSEKNAALYITALDFYGSGDFENARTSLAEFRKKDAHFYGAALLEAKLSFFDNDLADAQKRFEKLVKKFPQYTEARLWQIRCAVLDGKIETAQKLLESELLFNSSDWRVYYLYALLAALQENYEKRIAMLNRAEIHLEEAAKVFFEQSKIRFALGQNKRSSEYLEKARSIGGGVFAELIATVEKSRLIQSELMQ